MKSAGVSQSQVSLLANKVRLIGSRELARQLRLGKAALRSSELLASTEPSEPGRYFLILGHPRSGSTLLAALLDAHDDIGVAHEGEILGAAVRGKSKRTLLSRTEHHCSEFRKSGFRWEGYDYRVGDSQGSPAGVAVLGDKTAGRASETLAAHPDAIETLERTLDIPVSVLVLERNPLDVVATMVAKGRAFSDIGEALHRHINRVDAVSKLLERRKAGADLVLHHADLCEDPTNMVRSVVEFLGLQASAEFLEQCHGAVNQDLSRPSTKRSWELALVDKVLELCDTTPRLTRYSDEIRDTRTRLVANAST